MGITIKTDEEIRKSGKQAEFWQKHRTFSQQA